MAICVGMAYTAPDMDMDMVQTNTNMTMTMTTYINMKTAMDMKKYVLPNGMQRHRNAKSGAPDVQKSGIARRSAASGMGRS